MLTKATLDDIEKYGELAYRLARDQTRSCYPTFADGIKTKEDLLASARKGVALSQWELLLFSIDGQVEGWVQYFWIPDERYLQLYACNISRGTEQALTELLDLLAGRFSGYTLYFGFPGRNEQAIGFLRNAGFQCVEEDWNHSFFFADYQPVPEDGAVARIGRESFDDFRAVYRPDADAYWNCERILEQLERWAVFVYYQRDRPVGAVWLQGRDGYYEIYGLQTADGQWCARIGRALLAAALNHCKGLGARYMTYLCGQEAQEAALDLGFRCVGKYVLYIKKLK